MIIKRLKKQLERTKKKIMKLDKRRLNLIHKKHDLKDLIDIEEMKEGNKQ